MDRPAATALLAALCCAFGNFQVELAGRPEILPWASHQKQQPRLHFQKRDRPLDISHTPTNDTHGNKMSARDFEILYKETRLNLEPSTSSSIVQVRVGSHSQSSFSRSSTASARAINAADDEKAYRTRNIATASSVYYRKHHASPRGFHWRVLENDTVLSIRAADVCKPAHHQHQHNDTDAPLVLNLRFPSPIRTSCIGFSDPEALDALCVHVVDQSNQLHTITLRPDHFRKRLDGGLGDLCKSYSPSGFGFKQPHRLVVVSHEQILVTMHDGGIIRFDRNSRSNGEYSYTRIATENNG